MYFSPYIELYVLYLGQNNISLFGIASHFIEIHPADKILFAKE